MLKALLLAAAFTLAAGCSSSGGDDPAPTPTPPTTNPSDPAAPTNPTTTPPPTDQPTNPDATPGVPSGTIVGVWTGPTDFGTGVYVIDSNEFLYGFSSDGAGKFKSMFGPTSGLIERFDHRISDNLALGDAPTVVGDPDQEFASLSYLFEVTEDGMSLFNTSFLGDFTMALADDNAISIADVAGSWEAKTSFCETCPLAVNIDIAADGSLSGQTSFGDQGVLDPVNAIPLSGSVTGGGQFLNIEFIWDGKTRTGVAYRDPGTQKLMINTVGLESEEAGNRAFSALMTRTSGTTPTTPTPTPTPTDPTNPGDPSSADVSGVWTGTSDFGSGVYIIDPEQNLFGFSADGAGKFKSLFGPVSGLIERFDHRLGDNPALGDAFTVVGDPDMEFANLSYQFTLSEDGNSLTNTSALGSFTMTNAPDNAISIADISGNWISRTSFCDTCPLEVNLSITATGAVTGNTSFGLNGTIDPANVLPLTGTLTEAGQFLGITFNWDGKVRTGVVYRDIGTQKLMLNTIGFESAEAGNRAFSALLTRQ